MVATMLTLILTAFGGLVVLNLYFRVRVWRIYTRLTKGGVEFEMSDLFDRQKLHQEVLVRYPAHAKDIKAFARGIRFSLNIAIILIVLITIFGAILMFYRER